MVSLRIVTCTHNKVNGSFLNGCHSSNQIRNKNRSSKSWSEQEIYRYQQFGSQHSHAIELRFTQYRRRHVVCCKGRVGAAYRSERECKGQCNEVLCGWQ